MWGVYLWKVGDCKALEKHTRVLGSMKWLSGFRKGEKNKEDKIRWIWRAGRTALVDSVHGAEKNMNGCTALPDFLFKFFHFPLFCVCVCVCVCVCWFLSGPYNNIEFEKCTCCCNFWAPGGLMYLVLFCMLLNLFRHYSYLALTYKELWKQEACISCFPFPKVEANRSSFIWHI